MSADTHTHIHQLMSYELVYTSIHSSIIRDVSLNDVSRRACVSCTDYYKTRVSNQQKMIFISFVIKANFEKHGFMA